MMLTPQEAAKVLNCSADTVRRLCAIGAIPSVNIGTRRRTAWRIMECTVVMPAKQKAILQELSGTPMLDKYTRRG